MPASRSNPDPSAPARWIGNDLHLSIHVQPGAKRTEAAGLHGGAIKIRLQARPVEGAANEALLAFVASALQVSRRQVELVGGAASRSKRLRVERPDRALVERSLNEWGVPLPREG